ncbi:MAG: DUF1501 domain-containing protein [Verrucomicrobia bacterium]|nr:DUF1501 domain-containing protein [Verrucomicrobiota bacterium]
MDRLLRNVDEQSRRAFMARTAKSMLGVGLLPSLMPNSLLAGLNEGVSGPRKPTARKVIYLYMSGGMTHLDTLDPKPGSDSQGPVEAIKTKADGIQISEYLPMLAQEMDKVALIRSLSSTQGAHEQGNYYMHSSYQMRGTIQHPGLGAWIQKMDGRTNRTLPASVRIGGGSRGGGAGFMESKYAPLVLGDPNEGLRNSKRRDVTEQEFEDRLLLANQFDAAFHERYDQKDVRAYADMYADALRLMKSEDLQAFDLNKEKDEIREEYGRNGFGQGCLLARRLIENDVRFVEVTLGGWDTHSNNFDSAENLCATLDQGVASLLRDLERRGLLDETLVVLATEFGRTPTINQDNGRDHYPKAFSGFLAGGGIRGGQAFGVTDEMGANVLENGVSVPDFNATIAYALGLPLEERVFSRTGRPFTIADKGQPITSIFG